MQDFFKKRRSSVITHGSESESEVDLTGVPHEIGKEHIDLAGTNEHPNLSRLSVTPGGDCLPESLLVSHADSTGTAEKARAKLRM